MEWSREVTQLIVFLLFLKPNSDSFDTDNTEARLTGETSWPKQVLEFDWDLKKDEHKCECKYIHGKNTLSVQLKQPTTTSLLQREDKN